MNLNRTKEIFYLIWGRLSDIENYPPDCDSVFVKELALKDLLNEKFISEEEFIELEGYSFCPCCVYAERTVHVGSCDKCPIDYGYIGKKECGFENGRWVRWYMAVDSDNYKKAVTIAKEILEQTKWKE